MMKLSCSFRAGAVCFAATPSAFGKHSCLWQTPKGWNVLRHDCLVSKSFDAAAELCLHGLWHQGQSCEMASRVAVMGCQPWPITRAPRGCILTTTFSTHQSSRQYPLPCCHILTTREEQTVPCRKPLLQLCKACSSAHVLKVQQGFTMPSCDLARVYHARF